jgi:hypothetical protein
MAAAKDLRLDALQEIELAQKRIDALNERMAISNERHAKQLRAQIDDEKKYLKIKQDQLSADDKRLERNKKAAEKAKEKRDLEKEVKDNLDDQEKILSKLDKTTIAQLASQKGGMTTLAALQAKIMELESNRLTLNGDALKANNEMLAFFKEQEDAYLESVADTAKEKFKISDELKKRLDFEKKIANFGKEEQELARKNFEYEEKQLKVRERLHKVQEGFNELYEELPSEAQGLVDSAKKFGEAIKSASLFVIPFLLLGTAVEYFVEMDKASEGYRKNTGFTRDMMKDLEHSVHEIELDFRQFGIDAEKVYEVSKELENVFSDVAATTNKDVLGALTAITEATGTSAENVANVQGIFENIGNLSEETAANIQQQVVSLAIANKVSPKETLEDIAKSAEITSKFFRGDIQLLAKQAIEARKLGVSMDDLAKTAENLLDFESGIEEELKASTFVGGQFNLSRARALAMEGKLAQATEETLNQIQRSGDFTQKDYFTKQQLAKAAGMTVTQIEKELGIRDKLSRLSEKDKKAAQDAMDAGLDLGKIKDEDLKKKTEEFLQQNKINGQVTEMGNQFKAIAANAGQVFLPIIQAIAKTFEFLSEHTTLVKILLGMAAGYAVAMAIQSTIAAQQTAIRAALEQDIMIMQARSLGLKTEGLVLSTEEASVSAAGSVAKIFGGLASTGGLIALLAAGGIIGAMFGAMSSAKSEVTQAHDFELASGNDTPVLMAKGQAYQFDKSDDIIARPGLSKSLAGGNGSAGGNLVDALIGEMRAMRSEMANKTNDIYMDGTKVTAGIAYSVSKSTRNNYTLVG